MLIKPINLQHIFICASKMHIRSVVNKKALAGMLFAWLL